MLSHLRRRRAGLSFVYNYSRLGRQLNYACKADMDDDELLGVVVESEVDPGAGCEAPRR